MISAKPDPPSDDVFIAENFQPYKYSIAEAVALHQEFHHPTVFNNPSANIFARVEFNMTGKKKVSNVVEFQEYTVFL